MGGLLENSTPQLHNTKVWVGWHGPDRMAWPRLAGMAQIDWHGPDRSRMRSNAPEVVSGVLTFRNPKNASERILREIRSLLNCLFSSRVRKGALFTQEWIFQPLAIK